MTRGTIAAALLAAVALAGCSGGGDEPAARSTPVSVSAPTAAPVPDVSALEGSDEGAADSEGSVTDPDNRFIDYPDGFTARLAKVERVPTTWGVDVAASDALIRVTVKLENNSPAAVPLQNAAPRATLLYGTDRYEADPEGGYSGNPARALQNELPRQVAPGRTVTLVRTFRIPASEVDTLALWLSPKPDRYTDYTFTDLQTLVKTAR